MSGYTNGSFELTLLANEVLKESGDEGIAIVTGLKKAREYFDEHPQEKDNSPDD